jgi:colanic acid/amylovoran biosynthesis glycosyltransferase
MTPADRVDPVTSPATVAHLVTPYLFQTGSWIHTQLTRNREFRPVVLTQKTEHLEMFPFDPVYDLSRRSRGTARIWFLFCKHLLGRFPAGPYREIFAQEKVRLIHAHLGWEGARATRLARQSALPFVVSFYGRDAGVLPRKAYWRARYRKLFATADRIVAEGPHMGRVLAGIGAPADRVRVVHLGIPIEEFPFAERRDGGTDSVVGLIAASFREKKGIIYALDAVARLAQKHPRLRLRIIGDGPLRAQVVSRSQASDLAGRVALLGYQPYSVYKQELTKAQFMLAPSVTAADGDTEGGAPVCLLEAQSSGLPVVATTHCDIPEATRPGQSALLAPERDVPALAERLDELLSHPQRWAEMGRAGRAHVESEFNIDRQVARMNDLYRELL